METITLKVEGMTCGGCVASVTKVLTPLPGVGKVDVTLTPGEARIEYDAGKTNVDAFRKAIESAGFDVAN